MDLSESVWIYAPMIGPTDSENQSLMLEATAIHQFGFPHPSWSIKTLRQSSLYSDDFKHCRPSRIHEPSSSEWKMPNKRCSENFSMKKGKSTFWETCELVGKSQPLFKELEYSSASIFSKKYSTSAASPMAPTWFPPERMHAPTASDMTLIQILAERTRLFLT